MAIAQMQKILIVSHRSEAGELLEALQTDGLCQILNAEQALVSKEYPELHIETQKPRNVEEMVLRLNSGLVFLKGFVKKAGGISAALAPKMVMDQGQYEKIVADKSLIDCLGETEEVKADIEKLKNDIENYNGILATLKPWEKLETPVEELKQLTQATAITGLIPAMKYNDVVEKTAELGAELEKVGATSNGYACLIVCLNDDLVELQKILRSAEFEAVNFESMTGKIAENIEKNREKLAFSHKKLVEKFEKARILSKNYENLQVLFDHYTNLLGREVARTTAPATEQTVIFEGWAKVKDCKKLQKRIDSFPATSLSKIELAEGEEVPVEIDNNRAVKPFETITRLYGMPSNMDVDPTAFLAPFFALFFGLCLTDAAYGLILMGICWWMLKKMQGDKKALWMFFACSAMTVVAGALTGGWFGDAVQAFVPGMDSARRKIMLFDPMSDPLTFFMLSLGLGYLQIMVGLFIAFFNNLRHKDYPAAIFEQATWIIFLNSLLLFGFAKGGLISAKLSAPFGWIAIVGAVLIFLFTERKSGMAGRLGGGFYALFSTVFYFGDVLSYVRLMALGMVTGGLGMAINILVKLLMDMPYPVIGYILGGLLFVGGHLFNIAMSVLSSFVHSLRLQFVEFFPKFLAGGGRDFEPLRKDYKHIMIK